MTKITKTQNKREHNFKPFRATLVIDGMVGCFFGEVQNALGVRVSKGVKICIN
jgi:hypothetical protein